MVALALWAIAALVRERAEPGGPALDLKCRPDTQGVYVIMTGKETGPATQDNECPNSTRYFLGRKMDINSADIDDLDLLFGIGPRTADRVVSEREKRGGFKSIEEVESISGLSLQARQSLLAWTEVR